MDFDIKSIYTTIKDFILDKFPAASAVFDVLDGLVDMIPGGEEE